MLARYMRERADRPVRYAADPGALRRALALWLHGRLVTPHPQFHPYGTQGSRALMEAVAHGETGPIEAEIDRGVRHPLLEPVIEGYRRRRAAGPESLLNHLYMDTPAADLADRESQGPLAEILDQQKAPTLHDLVRQLLGSRNHANMYPRQKLALEGDAERGQHGHLGSLLALHHQLGMARGPAYANILTPAILPNLRLRDTMGETTMESDTRPNETVPEDYYAL